jgi:hypothetical protein
VRYYRELWLLLGGLFLTLVALLTAFAIAYFLKEPGYSLFVNWWMLGTLVSFLAAFTCFYGAIRGWPVPSGLRSQFPDIKVEIYGASSVETEHEGSTGLVVPVQLRTFSVRLSSAETQQHADLTMSLYVRLVPGSWGPVGEAVCPPPDWTLPPSLGLHALGMPVPLAAGNSVSGQLVYEIPGYYLDKIVQPMTARLEIWDLFTGQRREIPAVVGSYETSDMLVSSGGAQLIEPGPENDAQPEAAPEDASA